MHRYGGPYRRVHDGARRLPSHRSAGQEVSHLGGEGGGDPLFPTGVILESTGDPPGARLDGPLDSTDPASTTSSFPVPVFGCHRHGRFVVTEEPNQYSDANREVTPLVPQMDPIGTPPPPGFRESSSSPKSPLEPGLIDTVFDVVKTRTEKLIEDPLARCFTEDRVQVCIRVAVNEIRDASPCPFRSGATHYRSGQLTAGRFGVSMVRVNVPGMATSSARDVVALCDLDAVASLHRIRTVIESAPAELALTFGGWVSFAWCPQMLRAAVVSVEPEAEEEYYYAASLSRLATNGAVHIGASAEQAAESMAMFDGRRGIHPSYASSDSPFFKWYRTLVPRVDGWTSHKGARVTVLGAGFRSGTAGTDSEVPV